jgi:hypothetical protein
MEMQAEMIQPATNKGFALLYLESQSNELRRSWALLRE